MTFTIESGITIIGRKEWGALDPSFVPSINFPPKIIMFGYPQEHYAPKGKKFLGPNPTYEQALSEVKFIQRMDMKKYPDIKYNFLIAPNGLVFEGRGWENVPTLPKIYQKFSHITYYFMFIGDFSVHPPGEEYYQTREKLIEYGTKKDLIGKKFLFYTMRNGVKSPLDPYNYDTNCVNITRY